MIMLFNQLLDMLHLSGGTSRGYDNISYNMAHFSLCPMEEEHV
jgi:hypothetical protein